MNGRREDYARLGLARLGLILALAMVALWGWSMADTHLSAQQIGSDDTTFAITQPALSITKTATPTDEVPYHGTVTYTVVLGNSGPVSDTGVLLTDTLPVGVDFGRWATGGQPAGAKVIADELTWSGTVTAGQALTFTFVVSHVGDYGDVVINTARFSGTQQAGDDSATFAVAGPVTHTVYLPLVIKNYPPFLPVATTYGGTNWDEAYAVRQVGDGYVVAGNTESFGAGMKDGWVFELDADGSIVWQKTYGGTSNDLTTSIRQTSDGGYIVAGHTASFGVGGLDAWVFKLDAGGNIVWQRAYGGVNRDEVYVIQQTGDGGYIVVGVTDSYGAGNLDGWVLKLNADGSVAWQKTYGGPSIELVLTIQQTADGGYVMVGSTGSFGVGSLDIWVLKLDAVGGVTWQRTYGGTDSDYARAIQQTADGGYVVAGTTYSFGTGEGDAWVFKLNADGSIAWRKTYGGTSVDEAHAVQQATDGGYIVAGTTTSFGAGGYDAWVLKLNADGSVAWQKTYGAAGQDRTGTVQQTADGGYVVAGKTESFGVGNLDIWVLKLDANGNFCPGCALGVDTYVLPVDSGMTLTDSSAVATDSSAAMPNSGAIAADTIVVPNPICTCPLSFCNRLE